MKSPSPPSPPSADQPDRPGNDAAYAACLRELFLLKRFGVKLDLTFVRKALARLHDPHLAYPTVHIAGTNGKGSTAAMLERILRSAGLNTGLFTSPHLCRFTERIQVAGTEIPQSAVCRLYEDVSAQDEGLTFFERTALMAFCHFAEQRVDIAVIETGLGGRLDVTNLIRPQASAIVQIAADHTAYLGRHLTRIAWEKGGICKPGVPVVLAPGAHPAVRAVLASCAAARSAVPIWHPQDFNVTVEPGGSIIDGPYRYRSLRRNLRFPTLALKGRHQLINGAVALALAEQLSLHHTLPDEALRCGLADVRWPARSELWTPVDGAPILLDACHNTGGTQALLRLLRDLRFERLVLVAGAMHDKDLNGTLGPLAERADDIILTRADYYRACAPQKISARLKLEAASPCLESDSGRALALARRKARRRDLILVTGSVFLLGEIRAALSGETRDPYQVTDPVSAPQERNDDLRPPRTVRHARL
jgi:dihydrofolate synthase/folylpolyglutamate synthase